MSTNLTLILTVSLTKRLLDMASPKNYILI